MTSKCVETTCLNQKNYWIISPHDSKWLSQRHRARKNPDFGSFEKEIQSARQHTVLHAQLFTTRWDNSFMTFACCLHIHWRLLCPVGVVVRTSVHRWYVISDFAWKSASVGEIAVHFVESWWWGSMKLLFPLLKAGDEGRKCQSGMWECDKQSFIKKLSSILF